MFEHHQLDISEGDEINSKNSEAFCIGALLCGVLLSGVLLSVNEPRALITRESCSEVLNFLTTSSMENVGNTDWNDLEKYRGKNFSCLHGSYFENLEQSVIQ